MKITLTKFIALPLLAAGLYAQPPPAEEELILTLERSTDLQIWEQVELDASMLAGDGKLRVSAVLPVFYRMDIQTAFSEDFVLVLAGSYEMGDPFNEGSSAELPVHLLYITDFYMGRTEVTKARWDTVRTWAISSGLGYTDLPVGGGKGPTHPVHTVSWLDAVKWLNAWSEKEGLNPVYRVSGAVMRSGTSTPAIDYGANGYRLPTEAEWEKAARGGLSGKRFPWGDEINHDYANYRANGSAYTYDTSPYTTWTYHPTYNDGVMPYTSPVGSFAANGYGLYDMAGNLWEWCGDWYSDTYYSSTPMINPTGPASGSDRVGRGGGWYDGAFVCRAAYRGGINPDDRYFDIGFRPARTASP